MLLVVRRTGRRGPSAFGGEVSEGLGLSQRRWRTRRAREANYRLQKELGAKIISEELAFCKTLGQAAQGRSEIAFIAKRSANAWIRTHYC